VRSAKERGEAADMIDRFSGEIATVLEAGHAVQLTGFGAFSAREAMVSETESKDG